MQRLHPSALLLAAVLSAACAPDAATAPDADAVSPALLSRHQSGGPAAINQRLAAVRAATARFQRVDVALQHGYVSTVECASLPGVGAMGVHYVHPGLMSDATYDPLRPEVLVYEPQANGRMRLVAAEYLIFRAPWEAAGNTAAPMFGEVPFVESFGPAAHGLPDHYELHVWLWKHNPSGMFAQWNPTVSCAGAAAP